MKDYTQMYFSNGRKIVVRKTLSYWENSSQLFILLEYIGKQLLI